MGETKITKTLMDRIADDLEIMRHVLQSGKPADHSRVGYTAIVMVLAYVSAAAQAANQAVEHLE